MVFKGSTFWSPFVESGITIAEVDINNMVADRIHRNIIRFLLIILVCLCTKTYTQGADDIKPSKCPGKFCGRIKHDDGNFTSCWACPRGWRPNSDSICQQCTQNPSFYDWLYLSFMAILAPALHWFFIDFTNKRKNGKLVVLHVSAFMESVVAAICTLLVTNPLGSLAVTSCPVYDLSDWYSLFYNPNPEYTTTLHCTQEIPYPLYSMVMVYYAFCLVLLVLFRPMLSSKIVHGRGTKSIYAALYFFPILIVIQAVFAGLIYYSFPYIVLVVSVITSAAHFAYYSVQTPIFLIMDTFTNPRNLTIMVCHWLLHAFGIIAVTQLRDPALHASLLCLIPFPALFYLATVCFSDPELLESF